jgi:hypothetical protein
VEGIIPTRVRRLLKDYGVPLRVARWFRESINLSGWVTMCHWRCSDPLLARLSPASTRASYLLPPTMDSSNRIAIIRNILNQYPFSIGIFREIIQNSEDAKASKQVESFRHTFCSSHPNHFPQIFLLDCRVHPPARLSGKPLEHTNGPALLAFNDAAFRPEDWKGILATFGSSKRMDTS